MKKKSIKKNLKKKVKSSYETHDLGHETELPHRRKTSKNHEVKFSTIKKKQIVIIRTMTKCGIETK